LKQTIAAINGLANQREFVIHTGYVTHLAKPEQFDTAGLVDSVSLLQDGTIVATARIAAAPKP
jgi:hypothetical protein